MSNERLIPGGKPPALLGTARTPVTQVSAWAVVPVGGSVDVADSLSHVDSQTVAAVAACAAAGLSLVNVGYQAYLANRNESAKWRRDKLPETIRSFGNALSRMTGKVAFKDQFGEPAPANIHKLIEDDFARANVELDTLEIIGSQRLVEAARAVLHAATDIIDYLGHHPHGAPNHSREQERIAYWDYVELNHAFLCAARREIGLDPLLPSPGLIAWRCRQDDGSAQA
jgi:hypothetical protein